MLNSIFKYSRLAPLILRNSLYCTSSSGKTATGVPKNLLEKNQSSQHQEDGAVFDKKPFKLDMKADKLYCWCLCGKSKNQPLCDGTHKNIFLKIKYRPIRFKVEKDGTYWLCNCKHTKHRPFCDGTHKLPHIQNAVK